MRCYFRAMLAATAGLLPVAGAHASDLTISVVNVRSNAGELLVGVYATPQAYKSGIADSATKSALLPSAGRLLGAALRARAGSQSVTFGNVPAGRYAVVVIHDETTTACWTRMCLASRRKAMASATMPTASRCALVRGCGGHDRACADSHVV